MQNVFLTLLLAVSVIGCGSSEFTVRDHHDLPPAIFHDTIDIPVYGQCYEVEPGELYVENEGNHIDVYNNALCDHSPAPYKAFCDNIYQYHSCWVGDINFTIDGTYGMMVLHVREY